MIPTQTAILEGVRSVLRDKVRVPLPIELGTEIQRDLQLDSLRLLTLVVELENHFGMCFEPGDEVGITTVGELVHTVEKTLRLADRGAP